MKRAGPLAVILAALGGIFVLPACGDDSKGNAGAAGAGHGGSGGGAGSTGGGAGGRAPAPPRCEVVDCVSADDCCRIGSFVCHATCGDGTCSYACASDAECPNGALCSNGTCVACETADDCANATQFACDANACVPTCQGTSGCPLGQGCSNGRCVDGCDEDRDCSLRNAVANGTCNPDGSCLLPCSTDADCRDVDGWLHNATCTDGRCAVPGCVSDDQCYQALLASNPMDPGLRDDGAYVKCVQPK